MKILSQMLWWGLPAGAFALLYLVLVLLSRPRTPNRRRRSSQGRSS